MWYHYYFIIGKTTDYCFLCSTFMIKYAQTAFWLNFHFTEKSILRRIFINMGPFLCCCCSSLYFCPSQPKGEQLCTANAHRNQKTEIRQKDQHISSFRPVGVEGQPAEPQTSVRLLKRQTCLNYSFAFCCQTHVSTSCPHTDSLISLMTLTTVPSINVSWQSSMWSESLIRANNDFTSNFKMKTID